MAVLVEGISLVLKVTSLEELYSGGSERFIEDSPNSTCCSDSELVRIEFMSPVETETFVSQLSRFGFVYIENGNAKDLVVIDQQRGMSAQCDWAEFGRIDLDGDQNKKVSVCRLVGSQIKQMMTPEDWVYEDSLSSKFMFVESGHVPEFLDFLRHKNGLDVHRDIRTGKKVYASRLD